jgi:hypothetical protein
VLDEHEVVYSLLRVGDDQLEPLRACGLTRAYLLVRLAFARRCREPVTACSFVLRGGVEPVKNALM